MILPENERLGKYTRDYFTLRNCQEIQSWHKKIIRPDIASCLCYALKNRHVEEMRQASGIPFEQHLLKLSSGATRKPNLVVDLGAGRGEIIAFFTLLGIDVIGVDPSPGAQEIIPQTMKEWANTSDYKFYNLNSYLGMVEVAELDVDTIIMCESIEHIRPEEFNQAWGLICKTLTRTKGLFIVANTLKKHPIPVDNSGYDHIRRIDDAVYDALAKDARSTVGRKGSHMVLQF